MTGNPLDFRPALIIAEPLPHIYMKQSFILIFIVFSVHLQAQQTEKYLELLKGLEKLEVTRDTTKYNDGQIARTIEQTSYKYKSETYTVLTGKSVGYFKNGIVSNVSLQDDYGSFLSNKFYTKSGELKREWITTEIDANEKSPEEFIKSHGSGNFKRIINFYKYSKKLGKRYTYKKVYRSLTDNIIGGKIEYLDIYGQVKRTKIINRDGK